MEKRYQIFISSTFADLEKERKGIMEAIIELNCFPAGMEMFPATDTEQFEYIKSIIDESDYYIVVIAGRYGSIAEDGISYTEKEFDYAIAKGIPVLAFVKKDIENLPGSKIEKESVKRKKLDKFREKALEGRMARFWDNPDELKYVIHSSLSKEFKIHPRVGWIKANEDVDSIQKTTEEVKISQSEIDQVISVLQRQIDIPIEWPQGSYSTMKVTMEKLLTFFGTNLITPYSEAGFIRLTNNFVDYECNPEPAFGEAGAIMPMGLSKIKTILYSYGILDISDANAVEYYQYTPLGREVIKRIGKRAAF